MKVVRFLERETVIRFCGLSLIASPFVNVFLHLSFLKKQNHMNWSDIDFVYYLKSGNFLSYALALFSLVIGFKMLSGAAKAWKYVLFLIGAYLVIQIVNINSKAWEGPLAWPTFILNAVLFFFIFDQLVWKVKAEGAAAIVPVPIANPPLALVKEKHVINLNSYRRILFGFGSPTPWGQLKTLSSEELAVKSFATVPAGIENQVVEVKFSQDVVLEIKFSHQRGEMYYFTLLNMEKELVTRLNKWLKKIAV
jgi:hypothetical protein